MTENATTEFKVAIRATSKTVPLDEIERRIGIAPDRVLRVGEISPPMRVPSTINGWFLDSGLEKACSIIEHVDALSKRVGEKIANIAAATRADIVVQLSCGIFTEEYNFSPVLPPRITKFIADMNADLWLDIYFNGSSESHCRIRSERTQDKEHVHSVHRSAFDTDAEARLVNALRKNGNLIVSLVAEIGDAIVGHIAFSPVTLDGADAKGIGLAPVAVLPEYQREGIGGALIRAGIAECERLGYGFVVLLGHPAYYPRFGFSKASAFNLGNEYGADDAFMAHEIRKGAIPVGGGLIRYAPEFGAL